MMKPHLLLLSGLLVLLFSMETVNSQESNSTVFPTAELPDEVDRVLRDYEAAWSAGDADALAQLFSEDGFVLSSDNPITRGRQAIRARYANAGGALILRAIAYEVDERIGYIVGTYSYTEGVDQGKFVLTLRKVNDHWFITSDQDNTISR